LTAKAVLEVQGGLACGAGTARKNIGGDNHACIAREGATWIDVEVGGDNVCGCGIKWRRIGIGLGSVVVTHKSAVFNEDTAGRVSGDERLAFPVVIRKRDVRHQQIRNDISHMKIYQQETSWTVNDIRLKNGINYGDTVHVIDLDRAM